MPDENKKFFDGLLLGAFVVGLVLVSLIAFIIFQNAEEVGDESLSSLNLPHVGQEKNSPLIQLSHELGLVTNIEGRDYIVKSSFYDSVLNITYRTLQDKQTGKQYPSTWDGEGEQLLYRGELDFESALGRKEELLIKGIHSNHDVTILGDDNEVLIYNMLSNQIMTYEEHMASPHAHPHPYE